MKNNQERNEQIYELMELGANSGKVGKKYDMTRNAVLNAYNRMKRLKAEEKEIRENHGDWLLQFSTTLRKSLEYCGIYNEDDLYRVVRKERYIPCVGVARVEELNRVIQKRLAIKRQNGYTVLCVEG